MSNRKTWRINSWHGVYELEAGTTTGSKPVDNTALFFLLKAFRDRDASVMPALLAAHAALSGQTRFLHVPAAAIANTDLERIVKELRLYADAGSLHINSVDPVKKLYVMELPPEAEETVEEMAEEVNEIVSETSWFEVALKDEIEGMISGATVKFNVGDNTKSIATDSNGVARYTGGTAEEAEAIIKYPDGVAVPTPDPTPTWFEVRVADKEGKPLPQSVARFFIGNQKPKDVPCDPGTGVARLETVLNGEQHALVKILYPPLEAPGTIQAASTGQTAANQTATVHTEGNHWFEILVTDENGEPLPGADVVFTIKGEDFLVMSDEQGIARLENAAADEAVVTVERVVSAAVEDNESHASISTRALTDEQVQEALQYHLDQGDISLVGDTVPEVGKRVSLKENVIAGVTIMQLVDPFARGVEKTGDTPGQKHERDKFSWKPLTAYHRSLLDQRHALGLVRLCKNWLAPNGYKAFYTQGMNGDTSRKDCHGWGRALDFGGASTELPPSAANGATLTVRLGVDFIVYLHWGLIPMWDPKTVAASDDPTTWKRLLPWVIDDKTDFTQNPSGKKLHYRLDPPPYQDAENGKEPSAAIKEHFQKASSFFRDIVYKFAVQEYSDASSETGPGVPDAPTTEIDSHSGHFVLHPDYPKPNESGAKNGRNAHNNHFHMQLGPTNYGSTQVA